jgi:Tol biopolymer transport system component
MKTTWQTALMVVAVVCGLLAVRPAARQGDRADVMLQAAMTRQLVNGKLDEAIALYKQVVASPGVSHATAAKALLQMGACYEQLGNAEARLAYERIVKDFSDVSDVVAAARSKLSDFTAGPRAPSSALAMRRIYDGPGLDWCNGLSSDARYLSHADWNTSNIAVADLTTGQVRRVTTHVTGEYGECSIFSPDDKEIAFFWKAKDGAAELRTIGLDGSRLRVLYRNTEGTYPYLQPLDWSPDGRWILVVLSRQTLAISTSDGTSRVLKVNGGISAASFSPDGRYIAYSGSTSAESTKRDLSVMAADGSGDTALIRHPADDYLLGWAADGKTVFFASDRTGSYGVWSIGVLNGQPQGVPVLLKPDLGAIIPVRLLNTTLYYATRSSISDIYAASIDPATGRQQSPAALVKPYSTGSDFAADWSPDGKSLAYRSIRSGAGDPLSAPALVSILTLDTGQERQIRPALEGLDFNDGPHWSPDGRSLLVIAMQMTPERGVYRVDAETGATTPLVKAPRDQWLLHAVWGRDGRSVFYVQGSPTRIIRRDLATGRDVDLVSLANPVGLPGIALSPDGRWLAFTAWEAATSPIWTLSLVPADGGNVRGIYRAAAHEEIGSIVWTPDGRYLLFRKRISSAPGQNAPTETEFWRASPDGRVVEKTDLDLNGNWFAFSPDGRRLSFTVGQSKSELWALENLGAPRKSR